MAGNESPGDIFSGGGVPYIDAAQKNELASNQTPLGIVNATPKEGNQFGDDDTVFYVKGKALDGEHKLALSFTEARERQAKAVLDRLAAGATSIGPVYLSWEAFKGGKSGWVLQAEPGQGQDAASVAAILATPASDRPRDGGA
jgi:hypothetical protein